MTDNEIIQALECCGIIGSCVKCPYSTRHVMYCQEVSSKDAIDLIKRKQKEIDQLRDYHWRRFNAVSVGRSDSEDCSDLYNHEVLVVLKNNLGNINIEKAYFGENGGLFIFAESLSYKDSDGWCVTHVCKLPPFPEAGDSPG